MDGPARMGAHIFILLINIRRSEHHILRPSRPKKTVLPVLGPLGLIIHHRPLDPQKTRRAQGGTQTAHARVLGRAPREGGSRTCFGLFPSHG